MRKRWRQSPDIVIYFCVITLLFGTLFVQTGDRFARIKSAADLDSCDPDARIARIEPECFVWYPGELLSPEDFSSGEAVPSAGGITSQSARYGTYRLTLKLTPGEVYGLSGYSATFAQALWVDGQLLSAVGSPGEDAASTVSKSDYFTVYFEAKSETEIVIQWANHVHSTSGQLMPVFLGSQNAITHMVKSEQMRAVIMVGCLVAAFLFYFGIFLFFRKRRYFLWFSLACLLMAVRTLFIDQKLIMLLMPDMGWSISHKAESLITVGMLIFFFMYINLLFFKCIPRPVNFCEVLVACVYAVFVLFAPSLMYTAMMPYVKALSVLYMVAVVGFVAHGAIMRPEYRRTEQLLVIFSTVIYVLMILGDTILHDSGWQDDTNLVQQGMVILVFANTLALALVFTRTETELVRVKQLEREMAETNMLLERLNLMKTNFLANISHEMKTPLTVMSNSAELTRMQIEEDIVDSDMLEMLSDIATEAQRLGRLVEELLRVAAEERSRTGYTRVPVSKLLDRARQLTAPILTKNGNSLRLETSPSAPDVRANEDMIIQVLWNLITNANRHVEDGVIVLNAAVRGGVMEISVSDSGDGIPPELLPDVFERNVSGDGSTGLGLAIAKEALEEHGGTIDIESERGKGTLVRFTLPLYAEEQL